MTCLYISTKLNYYVVDQAGRCQYHFYVNVCQGMASTRRKMCLKWTRASSFVFDGV